MLTFRLNVVLALYPLKETSDKSVLATSHLHQHWGGEAKWL